MQPDGKGLRFNAGKIRLDLIPVEPLLALGEHYGRGGIKYPERNWERGMSWMDCYASLDRHSKAWLRGENFDQETGSHHMIAVAWNAFALHTYWVRDIGKDDRPLYIAKRPIFLELPEPLKQKLAEKQQQSNPT